MTGLRERKKQRTREQIVRAALELFAERGFDRATVADIAEAADISPRTFFGYFAAKEDVVFHDADELLEHFTARIREREAGEDVFDALRSFVREAGAVERFDRPQERARRRLVRETPALAARERAHSARAEALLAEAVGEDLGAPAGSLRPLLVSAAAIAALEAVERLHDEGDSARSAEDVLDEALVFLKGGLDALRNAPHPAGGTGAAGRRRP